MRILESNVRVLVLERDEDAACDSVNREFMDQGYKAYQATVWLDGEVVDGLGGILAWEAREALEVAKDHGMFADVVINLYVGG